MSSGHLREAEAPPEAAAENAGVQWTPPRSGSTDRGDSRESPGHLRVAEAPTEAVDLRGRGGEDVEIYFSLPFLRKGSGGAGVQWTPLRSRSTDRGGSREFPILRYG